MGEVEARGREQLGVELDEAVGGRVGEELAFVSRGERSVGAHHGGADTARADVDDEDASGGGHCYGQSTAPKGLARPSLPGLRMPFGSSVSFTDCNTPKPVPSASATNRERLRPTPW